MSVQTDIKLIDNASKVLAGINDKVDKLHDKVDAINNTSIKPKDMIETESAFSRLVGGSKDLLGAFSKISVSLYGIKEIFNGISSVVGTITNYSDTLSETTARLNLMNDGLISTDELWNEIYLSSMRSRGSIVDTADAVAKLGLTTKGVFKDNKELVQFSENLTKSFKISGTSTQGISSAMLQLTQAMSSGVLRGEELNSIFENAPLLIQYIADYMDVPIGQIRDLASEGKITADIVKNAILGATDEINQKFDEMPMKFEELGTQFSNIWYNNMQMAQDSLEGIPQNLANNLLPVWDAFTYALFVDLDGIYKEQQKGINNTTSAYADFAKQVSTYTGYVISENEAMKISFTSNFEMLESLFKKTGNVLIETVDFTLDTIDWLVSETTKAIMIALNEIAKAIDGISMGLTNLSSETEEWANYWGEKAAIDWNNMNTYENRLNDKYFGVPIWDLSQTITDQAIDRVVLDSMKRDPNSLLNSTIFTGKTVSGGYYPQLPGVVSLLPSSEKSSYEPISLPKNDISGIARDVSDISKSINNLNDLNKAIMEINEATYHNNVANQFNGNIEIVAYGVDEEGQKAIGKSTEEAIRRVFLNDYQNMQAMGVYA